MGVLGRRSWRSGRPAESWSTKKSEGARRSSSEVKRAMARIRCSWRRMAQRMEKRPRIEGGMSVLPRTRTSRVPLPLG